MLQRPHHVWLLMAAGFAFLAVDELGELHERMDRFIIRGLDLPHNPLTDLIDDAIMMSYGLTGLGVLWIYRKELLAYQRSMRGPMMGGFCCLFLGLLCDPAPNDDRFFHWLTGDMPLLPEGLFMAAFYAVWQETRASGAPLYPPAPVPSMLEPSGNPFLRTN